MKADMWAHVIIENKNLGKWYLAMCIWVGWQIISKSSWFLPVPSRGRLPVIPVVIYGPGLHPFPIISEPRPHKPAAPFASIPWEANTTHGTRRPPHGPAWPWAHLIHRTSPHVTPAKWGRGPLSLRAPPVSQSLPCHSRGRALSPPFI